VESNGLIGRENSRQDQRPKASASEVKPKSPVQKVQFKLHGEEVVHKTVSASGKCGRIYLPLGWVGKKVKIIRVD
jgi:putative transposon-encoded protein